MRPPSRVYKLTGPDGERLELRCSADTLVSAIEKRLMKQYNYPPIAFCAAGNPHEVIPRNSCMGSIPSELQLIKAPRQPPEDLHTEENNLATNAAQSRLSRPQLHLEKPLHEKRNSTSGSGFKGPPSRMRNSSAEPFSLSARERPFYRKPFLKTRPDKSHWTTQEKQEEHPPEDEAVAQPRISRLASATNPNRSPSTERTGSSSSDTLCIICRIPEISKVFMVSMRVDSTVLDLVESLKQEVDGIGSPISVVRNRKVLPLSDTKLFTLGIRGSCTVYIGSGEYSNPEIVSLLEVEDSLATIEEEQKKSLTVLQKDAYYEELMKLLLSIDGLDTLEGEWRQRRRENVRRITLLQDSLKPSSM